jgi:hypothetical protein
MRRLATILIAAVLFSSLAAPKAAAQDQSRPNYTLSPAQAKQVIAERARQIMLAIKRRDMRALASYVHPRKGVRFSPYAYVDKKTHRVLSRQQLVRFYNSRQRLVWGEADGSGDPLRMTFRQYLKSFVYRMDLLTDKAPTYNPERPQGGGTTVNNIGEAYRGNIIIVGYSHAGITAPQGGGMDWQNLFLVFEKLGSQWYLVGIVNDEWTI